ncbi:hypothetical protein AgCh_023507 [Apium graveolens]
MLLARKPKWFAGIIAREWVSILDSYILRSESFDDFWFKRCQQSVPPKMSNAKNMFVFMNFLYTLVVLKCSCVLSLHETLVAYKSVYFIAIIVPITLVILGKIINPVKPARTKIQKEE